MQLTMLANGQTYLARTKHNRERLVISHFAIGGAAGYPFLDNAIGFKTPSMYKARIDAQTVSGDTAVFTCILPANVAFTFGELAVLSPDGGFVAMTVLATPLVKVAGTEMHLTLQLSTQGLGTQMTFQSQGVYLSRTRPDFDDALLQLQAAAAERTSFAALVTNETGNTLLELMAGVVDMDSYMFESALQEGFSETAKLDSSQYAAQIMLGNRITRKIPAGATFTLTRTNAFNSLSIPAYTAWTANGIELFNRESVQFKAGQTSQTVRLYKGSVVNRVISGTGEDYQFWVSPDSKFTVSDVDVEVSVSGVSIPVVQDSMWNYNGQPAVQDRTDKSGALRLFFGNATLGTRPLATEQVQVVYAVTDGSAGNDSAFTGQAVSPIGYSTVSGVATTPLTGGGDQPATSLYQRMGGDLYGGQRGAVTPSQYRAKARDYPGVIDAVVLAQRDLAPMNKDWFNVGKVILLTQSPWTAQDKADYEQWLRKRTIYSMRYQILTGTEGDTEPKAKSIDVRGVIGCRSDADLSNIQALAEGATRKFFIPRAGILSRDVYIEDITSAIRAVASEQIDYIELELPTTDVSMDIFSPKNLTVTIQEGVGTLPPGTYTYGVASVDADGISSPTVISVTLTAAQSTVRFDWATVPAATGYKVYGRTDPFGELATVTDKFYVDDGTAVGTGAAPAPINTSGVHYAQLGTLDLQVVFSRRRAIEDLGYGRA